MVHVLAQSQNLSSYYREILFCGELFLCFELKFHKIIIVVNDDCTCTVHVLPISKQYTDNEISAFHVLCEAHRHKVL